MYESALRGAIPLASNTKRSLTSDSLLNCSLIELIIKDQKTYLDQGYVKSAQGIILHPYNHHLNRC